MKVNVQLATKKRLFRFPKMDDPASDLLEALKMVALYFFFVCFIFFACCLDYIYFLSIICWVIIYINCYDMVLLLAIVTSQVTKFRDNSNAININKCSPFRFHVQFFLFDFSKTLSLYQIPTTIIIS